ncbi:MAG: replication-associated recombination protein A [Chlamydiales bacterium]|nr:replication-associated recombination protein A [Chlamydiales bacterium]
MSTAPLSEKERPKTLSDVVGQDHLVGDNGFITRTIQSGVPLSILLWGPPGCGKTSIARLYAQAFSYRFVTLSAIFSGIADLRRIVKEAEATALLHRGTVVFVDEIHRFNKAQQEAFLPFLEDGTLVLVGATAENPSFHLSNALLSRLRVLTLHALDDNALEAMLGRYEKRHGQLPLDSDARKLLVHSAQGDGRYLYNMIENLQASKPDATLTADELTEYLQRRAASYDRAGDQHYNMISALHKSVRGSDPDAALYWLCRMLEGGEDPLFIARRLIRMANEDIGLADPNALTLAVATRETYHMLGSPEGELALAQMTVYLALAPKSNSIYRAYGAAQALAKETTHLPPPKHILNAPTRLMKQEGYGKDYQYDHDTKHGFSGQNYFPDELSRHYFYDPANIGFERDMKKRLDYFAKLREQLGEKK